MMLGRCCQPFFVCIGVCLSCVRRMCTSPRCASCEMVKGDLSATKNFCAPSTGMRMKSNSELGLNLFADPDFAGIVPRKILMILLVRKAENFITLGGVPVTRESKFWTKIALSLWSQNSLSTGMRELVELRKLLLWLTKKED